MSKIAQAVPAYLSASTVIRIKGLNHLHDDMFELSDVKERHIEGQLMIDALGGEVSEELMEKIHALIRKHDLVELLTKRISY